MVVLNPYRSPDSHGVSRRRSVTALGCTRRMLECGKAHLSAREWMACIMCLLVALVWVVLGARAVYMWLTRGGPFPSPVEVLPPPTLLLVMTAGVLYAVLIATVACACWAVCAAAITYRKRGNGPESVGQPPGPALPDQPGDIP